MVYSDNASVDWEAVKLGVNRVMQRENNIKFAKVKRNLRKVTPEKAGSKKLFCQIIVLK